MLLKRLGDVMNDGWTSIQHTVLCFVVVSFKQEQTEHTLEST